MTLVTGEKMVVDRPKDADKGPKKAYKVTHKGTETTFLLTEYDAQRMGLTESEDDKSETSEKPSPAKRGRPKSKED